LQAVRLKVSEGLNSWLNAPLDMKAWAAWFLEKLIERGLVKEPLDLFELKVDQLGKLNLGSMTNLESLEKKNATKVVEAWNELKHFLCPAGFTLLAFKKW